MVEIEHKLPIIAATVHLDRHGNPLARRRDKSGWYTHHSAVSTHLAKLRGVELSTGLLGTHYTMEELEAAINPLRAEYRNVMGKDFALGVYVAVEGRDTEGEMHITYPFNDLGVWESTSFVPRPRSSQRSS